MLLGLLVLSVLLPDAAVGLASVAGGFLYNALLDGGQQGQTLGKMVLRIRVISNATGGPLGIERGLMRSLLPLAFGVVSVVGEGPRAIAALASLLDGLWPLWDGQRQTWHDKTAGSVVVKLERNDA